MRDLLMDGLPVLDLLEITCSTGRVAALTHCDQSSVSRLWRHASDQLGLDFRKTRGQYQAHANHGILRSLRQAAQLLRLNQDGSRLRWLGNPWKTRNLQRVGRSDPLARPWLCEQRTLKLLTERVLDLAVIDGLSALPHIWQDSDGDVRHDDWVTVKLVNHPIERASFPDQDPLHRPGQLHAGAASPRGGRNQAGIILLHEHLEHPAVQELIGLIREDYLNPCRKEPT